jgi:cell division protein FtsB
MQSDKKVALRKRTMIEKANRTMFVWVACASVVVGVSIVAIIFLVQMLMFNEKVLAEKNRTVATLKQNNANVPDLEAAVRVLDTDQALIDAKANSDDQAVQVILDALPSEVNSLAFGSSLQTKILNIPGLTIDKMQVDPVQGIESFEMGTSQNAVSGNSSSSQGEITFRVSVIGSEAVLKQALLNIEKSIRTIDITMLKIETQTNANMMTIEGRAYYEPARTVELKEMVIK